MIKLEGLRDEYLHERLAVIERMTKAEAKKGDSMLVGRLSSLLRASDAVLDELMCREINRELEVTEQ